MVGGFFGSGDIASGTVGGPDLASGAVGSGQLQSGCVWGHGIIWTGAVPPFHIVSGTISNEDIGRECICDYNLISGCVSWTKLGSGAVANANVAPGQIAGDLAPSGWVTSLRSGSIGPGSLGSGVVGPRHLGSGVIDAHHLASGTAAGLAKWWASWSALGGGAALINGHNVTSVTRIGVGRFLVTLTSGFACSGWVPFGMARTDQSDADGNCLSVGIYRGSGSITQNKLIVTTVLPSTTSPYSIDPDYVGVGGVGT